MRERERERENVREGEKQRERERERLETECKSGCVVICTFRFMGANGFKDQGSPREGGTLQPDPTLQMTVCKLRQVHRMDH